MFDFIHFDHPWFLLLMIPALAVILIPHFRVNKRYRRNRNRITALVLACIVAVLATLLAAGFVISYDVPNTKNEILILVDVSDSENGDDTSKEMRDEFVERVINYSRYDGFNVGVVTFGFNQVNAVPFTNKIETIYNKYAQSLVDNLPDTSATNIAGAILYAKDLFTNPESAKIVLVTDGRETDGSALAVIKTVVASGIKVDVANIPTTFSEEELQVTGMELPDYHINVDEEFNINVNLKVGVDSATTVTLKDNGVVVATESQNLTPGAHIIPLKNTFTEFGLHELTVEVDAGGMDTIPQNNCYTTYLDLALYNKILIVEREDDYSDDLSKLLTNNYKDFEIETRNIFDVDFPTQVDQLRQYDQIILNNIANEDMPEGFDTQLYEYVYTYGGGLFTVGGQDEEDNANTYNPEDMAGTLYQQMLPVTAKNYTPPLGVLILIDHSGSMTTQLDGKTYYDWAKEGAKSCLNAMSDRDYIGLMTLDDTYDVILPLTPRTQESKILGAIEKLEDANGGTVFTGSYEKAVTALNALTNVDRRHVIIVSDGMASDIEEFEAVVEAAYNTSGITLSMVIMGGEGVDGMRHAVEELGHGRIYSVAGTADKFIHDMREDLNVPEIKDVNYEEFHPIVYNLTSPLVQGLEQISLDGNEHRLSGSLDGFYGTKVKDGADLVLVGNYEVPIYAQWKLGKGLVGSFMCDLANYWSGNFMADADGQTFITNAVKNLMPTENIRPSSIVYDLKEQNYTNQINVFTSLEKGEYVGGTITSISAIGDDAKDVNEQFSAVTPEEKLADAVCYVTTAFTVENNYSRCEFVVKQPGVYEITLIKYNEANQPIETVVFHKALSYSAEYNAFDETNPEETALNLNATLAEIANKGKGHLIADLEDPEEVFDEFVTTLKKVIDPRTLFAILIIVLFLLVIIVRKFKFKWPHEIIQKLIEKSGKK